MSRPVLFVRGGQQLTGSVEIQGSKNTVLPILAATLLCKDITTIYHCPHITDVDHMIEILLDLGCHVRWYGHTLVVDSRTICHTEISEYMSKKMRASVLFLGALLGRGQKASMGLPGGCQIGKRPINYHLDGFRSLGILVEEKDKIYCTRENYHGAEYQFLTSSVGATENMLLASVLAPGTTTLKGCAIEPEVSDLASFLCSMGAKIEGIGTHTLIVTGVEKLSGTKYYVPSDRIAAGTYLLAAVISKGKLRLYMEEWGRLEAVIKLCKKMGAQIECSETFIDVQMKKIPNAIQITTSPYPGIPTDLQSMLLVVSCVAEGTSTIQETIFENRFGVAEELKKMGGNISVSGNTVKIQGIQQLESARLTAKDLRGGAALLLAAIAAKGESQIAGLENINRGYEDFIRSFANLGAKLWLS